jgi:hypothetical protein
MSSYLAQGSSALVQFDCGFSSAQTVICAAKPSHTAKTPATNVLFLRKRLHQGGSLENAPARPRYPYRSELMFLDFRGIVEVFRACGFRQLLSFRR